MRRSILPSLSVVVLVVTLTSPVHAAAAPTRLTTRGFLLDATAYEGETLTAGGWLAGINATLKDAAGAPIAGRTIAFTKQREPICTSTTDAQGYAACDAPPTSYTASFVGDATYGPSSATGFAVSLYAADRIEAHVYGDGSSFDMTVH